MRETGRAADAVLVQKCTGAHLFSVFNNSNWLRTSVVLIPVEEAAALCAQQVGTGNFYRMQNGGRGSKDPLPCVWKEEGAYVLVRDMEPFAYTDIEWQPEEIPREQPEEMTVKAGEIRTPFYEISWNEKGQLSRIYDREAEREILPRGACANVLQIFEDKPRCFDAWELEPGIDRKREEITDCTQIRIRRHGLGTEVSFCWKYHKSRISQTMCLYNEKRRIDFCTKVDWQERQKLMKAAFPVDIRAVDARFDIQNGNIRRPITRNTSWEAAKFEVAAHKWVDIWETGYGAALLNDCKYGYDLKENTMRLTLLKAATDPDYSADLGSHTFTYSLLPHMEEWYNAAIEQEAFDLNTPLKAKAGAAAVHGSILTFDRDNLVADALKQAENGEEIVLRFHEFQGKRGEVSIRTGFHVDKWCECDLMEEPESPFTSSEIRVSLHPYEIKTLLLRVKDGQKMESGDLAT